MARRPSRARRVLGVIGAVVGTTVTFAFSAAAGVVLHLDVPATRRLVAAQVTNVLHAQLRGDVTIERIGGLGLHGVDGVRARVKDPDGVQVLFVDGVRVRVRAVEAARSALFGKGPIRIDVDDATIDHVDHDLDTDAAGTPRIANAFQPKNPSPPKPKDEKPGRGVDVRAPHVVLRHAWAHGTPPGAPPIDAELRNLAARAVMDANGVRADLDRVEVVGRNLPKNADPDGVVRGHLEMPSKSGANMIVNADFEGAIGGIPTSAEASMDGKRVDARLDVESATSGRVRSMLGEVPLHDTVTVHAEAHGVLPAIDGKVHATLGQATADVDAHLETGTTTNVRAALRVRRVDLRSLVPSAPPSRLGLDGAGRVAIGPNGKLDADVGLETLPGRLGDDAVPRVRVRGAYSGDRAQANVKVLDPDLATTVDVIMEPEGGSRVVDAHVVSNVPDLRKIPRASGAVRGSATLDARARLDLGSKAVDGRVLVRGQRVAYTTNGVDDVTVLATARGTIDRPTVDVGVHAEGVSAAGQRADALDVRGRITPPGGRRPLVVTNAHVDLVKAGEPLAVTATRIEAQGPTLVVEGGVVQGLGAPIEASLKKTARELHVSVDAPSIDLSRVARAAGMEKTIRRGTVSLDGDVTLGRDAANGDLHLRAHDVCAARVDHANAKLDASFGGKELDVGLAATLGDAGSIALRTKRLRVAGSPADPAAWRDAVGRVFVDADVDLAKVASVLPDGALPVGDLHGEAVVRGVVGRPNAAQAPEFRVSAYTRGLVVSGKAVPEQPLDATRVKGVEPWRSDDVDLHLDARVDAPTGEGEIALLAYDRRGAVASFDAKATLPYSEMLKAPAAAARSLVDVPVTARLVVPPRALEHMPHVLGLSGFTGNVSATLDVSGTAREPHVALEAHTRGVRSPAMPVHTATDADVAFAYDGEAADLTAKVRETQGEKEVLALATHADVRARDLVEPTPGKPLDWDASARVKLEGFRLQSVGPLADRSVRGRASGEIVLEGLHRDAKLAANVALENLRVGRARYEKAVLTASAKDGRLDAHARFDQTDGFADLRADAGLAWGANVAPKLDPSRPVEARLQAKDFRAAAVAPFVQGPVNGVDGRLDADATVRLGPGPNDTKLAGHLELRDGRVDVAALGEELRDVRAKVAIEPDGRIVVKDAGARGVEGQVHADAEVRLKGLSLASARANVTIPKGEAFDVSLQGQPLGDVYGDAHVTAQTTPQGAMKVAVDVPSLNVRLPQVMKTGLQELGEKKNVRAGVFRDGTFVRLPLDREDLKGDDEDKGKSKGAVAAKGATQLDVHLGDITIVRGNQARVVIGGATHVEAGDEARVSGQIAVKEGEVDLQGKKFKVERGTITFQPEDASDPIIVATASWTAADGTKVYADFVGPVKTGKVNLRSEPPRPKNEILALILFGTADGVNAPPPPPGRAPNGTTKAAVAVGGGFAAQGLSEALDDLAGIQAQARIDTTEANNPRPELEIQVTQDVSVALGHVLGTPPITEPDKNLVRGDWRFEKNWSLETIFGDRGKAEVDAIWQRRY